MASQRHCLALRSRSPANQTCINKKYYYYQHGRCRAYSLWRKQADDAPIDIFHFPVPGSRAVCLLGLDDSTDFFWPLFVLTTAGCVSVSPVHDISARGSVSTGRVPEQGGRSAVQAAAAWRRLRHDPEPGKGRSYVTSKKKHNELRQQGDIFANCGICHDLTNRFQK